jgi:hypothetical protein
MLGPRCRRIIPGGIGSENRLNSVGPRFLTKLAFWDPITDLTFDNEERNRI